MTTLRYIAVRLGQMLLTIIGIMTILFFLLQASGDPAIIVAGPAATLDVVEAVRVKLGLDQPLIVQYGLYLRGLARLDFGNSFTFNQPALDTILEVLPASLAIVIPALLLSSVLGIAIGAAAAMSKRKRLVRALMTVTFVGHSVPFFWLGIIFVLVFALQWQLLPPVGSGGLQFVILPIAAMTVSHLASLARLTLGEMSEAARRPYVMTATSKGLSPRTIVLRHILPNALPPVISWIGIVFAFCLGQLLIIEPLFAYRGLGGTLVQAVQGHDFPIVEAGTFVISLLVSSGNLAADLLNRALDPGLAESAPR